LRRLIDAAGWMTSVLLMLLAATAQAANGVEIRPADSSVPAMLSAGASAAVRIRVVNNGTTTWSPAALHRLGAQYTGAVNQVTWSGFGCGGYMNSATDGRALLCGTVPPGATQDIAFNITVPPGASRSCSGSAGATVGVPVRRGRSQRRAQAVLYTLPQPGSAVMECSPRAVRGGRLSGEILSVTNWATGYAALS
jgi:hypothetical protein